MPWHECKKGWVGVPERVTHTDGIISLLVDGGS